MWHQSLSRMGGNLIDDWNNVLSSSLHYFTYIGAVSFGIVGKTGVSGGNHQPSANALKSMLRVCE